MPPSRRSFLLRIDPPVLDAIQRWANDDLRSLNSHIEFLLRRALAQAGRTPSRTAIAASEEGQKTSAADDSAPDTRPGE
jgi:hypothetical protein